MLRPLVLWGASGHAKVLHEFCAALGFQVVALFDNSTEVRAPLPGVPVYIGREGFLTWRTANFHPDTAGLVAIGGDRGRARLEIQEFMRDQGIEIVTAVHPSAYVAADARLGRGTHILAHATVGADVEIGEACIINTAASVDHECRLGAGVHVAPGATLAGCIEVGPGAMIAVGATVLPRIKVGMDSIVGAGAVVTRDVPDRAVVVGCPARIQRWR